jgi:hypothetical protein
VSVRRFLSLFNDSGSSVRGMDIDAPHPRCSFCGLPLRARFSKLSTLQAFDCNSCQVILDVTLQDGRLEIAESVVAQN